MGMIGVGRCIATFNYLFHNKMLTATGMISGPAN